MKKRNSLLLAGSLLVLIVIFTTIKFPHKIKATCLIVPKAEWSLIRVDPEKLKSRLLNYQEGKVISYSLLQYDREDFVQFEMNPLLRDNQWINQGDTIAVLSSSKNQMMLKNFEGELQKAKANLAMVSTGEKTALQDEAQQALRIAEIELNAFEPQYKRKIELYGQDLISAEEWETAKATFNMYQSNVTMAKARYHAIRSGEKKEIIQYMQAQIDQISEQVRTVKDKLKRETILSPHGGILTFSGGDSVLCRVDQVDTLLIRLAIPAGDLKYVKPGQKISILISETGNFYNARLTSIRKRSFIMQGRPVYFITGKIQTEQEDLIPGMSGYAKIRSEDTTLATRFIRAFKSYPGINLL
jgi:hypothetical protein